MYIWGFPGGSEVKNPSAIAGDTGSIPGSGIFPGETKWQPTAVFLPGKSHGQRRGLQSMGLPRVGHDWATKRTTIKNKTKKELQYVYLYIFNESESCSNFVTHGIVHGNLQARILEWVAFPFSRGSSQPRD